MSKKTVFPIICCLVIISIFVGISCESNQKFNNEFLDVKENDWFYSDVEYVTKNSLMNGTGDSTFAPQGEATRGMVVTVLWRLEGEVKTAYINSFSDVKSDAYYYNAVLWAVENKIVNGYSSETFGPDDYITREQLAAVFYRYASYKGYNISGVAELTSYNDAPNISDYALVAFKWAVANGIISGTSDKTLSPSDTATRSQIAAILKRFAEKYNTSEDKPEATIKPVDDNEERGDIVIVDKESFVPGKDKVDDKDDSNLAIIQVENVAASPGSEVDVKVSFKNNPGILGMILSVDYNESIFKLESVENGDALSVLTFTPSNVLGGGSRFVWDGIEISNSDIKDGTFLNMKFKVSIEAEPGKYPVNLVYGEGDIIDNNLNSISPKISLGYIEIK